MDINICKIDSLNNIIETRIEPIIEQKFISLLRHSNNKNYIYKNIHEPSFSYGVYDKSYKSSNDEYVLHRNGDTEIDTSFPEKEYSLVCSTNDDNNILGTTFLVFPFKDALFTIKHKDDYLKGFWSDKIVWLDRFKRNELWTEDKCILIEKSIWFEKLQHLYNK